MYIERLEIEGFKSFASRTIVQFDKGISGVVGPNGCGKSNIVDAIKWCLGEQSAKSLRGHVMGDVIFNGSSTKKASPVAEVSIVFHKGDAEFKGVFLGLDNVQVTRKLNRSGTSTYYLNHAKVRLKDVQLFFMDTGLYNQRYALIEQGQIGQIIEAKPNQMRLLFEEAAGISHFKESKELSESKLQSTQENLDKIQIIADNLHKQLLSLEKQAEKAILHRRLSSVLRQTSCAYLLGEYKRTMDNLQEATNTLEQFRLQELEVETDTNRKWNMMVQAKQSLQSNQERYSEVQKKSKLVAQQLSTAETTLLFHDKEIIALQEQIQQLQQQILELSSKREASERELQDQKSKLQIAEEQMKEASHARAIALDAHNRATQAIKKTDQDIEANKRASDGWRTRLAKIAGEIVAIEQRLVDIQKDEASRAKEIDKLQDHKHKQEEKIAGLVEQQFQLNLTKQAELTKQNNIRTVISEYTAILQEKQKIEKEAVSCRQRSEQQKNMVSNTLDSYQRMLHAHEGVPSNTKNLLQLPNVLGLLPELLDVPKELEELFLLVLGEDVDCIVVTQPSTIPMIIQQAKGRNRVLCISNSDTNIDLGIFAPISGESLAVQALYQLLGTVAMIDDISTVVVPTHCTWVEKKSHAVYRNGMTTNGKVSSIAGELLHRRRVIQEQEQKLRILQEQLVIDVQKEQQAKQQVAIASAQLQQQVQADQEQQKKSKLMEAQIQDIQREEQAIRREVTTIQRLFDTQNTYQQQLYREQEEKRKQKQHLLQEQQEKQQLVDGNELQLRSLQEQRNQEMKYAGQMSATRHETDALCLQLSERLLQLKRLYDQVSQVHVDLVQRIHTAETQLSQAYTKEENTRNTNATIQLQRVELQKQAQDIQQEIEKYQKVISQWVEHSEKLDLSYKESQKEKDTLTQQRLKQEQVTDSLQKQVFHLREKSQKEQQMDVRSTLATIQNNQQIIFEALDGVLAIEPIDVQEEQMTMPLYVLWSDIQDGATLQKWKHSVDHYTAQIQSMGAVNFMAIEERVSIAQEYEMVLAQQKDLEDSMQQIVDTIQQLDDICSVRFMETVTAVDAQFRQVYPRLLGGGLSFVEILDPSKPLETGVSIFAQPPGKKLERLSLLSGGERAMVAIALLFSLFSVKPSPVCLLDEVDAPLDEANGERFNTMLQEMSRNSQFIVITHNKKTMEAMDVLYGISMPIPGVSQLVSVRFE